MPELKLFNFCGKWQLFSYKFDQPCFSIFYSFLKCAASSNICISHNITWNQTAQVFLGTPGTHGECIVCKILDGQNHSQYGIFIGKWQWVSLENFKIFLYIMGRCFAP
jgi:hypothetical protein